MANQEINTIEDLFSMLDQYTKGVKWDTFYTERNKPAPFLTNSRTPDKHVVDFIQNHSVKRAVEFGCGEGRNAIYMAQNGILVDAFDLSETAIQNAKKVAKETHTSSVSFEACDIFQKDYHRRTYDLAVDCGLFHHLPPHRRLHYLEILKFVLQKDGYFLLLCFADGEGAADDVDDYAFYQARRTGVSFTEERLRHFFGRDFAILQIEKGSDIHTPEMLESPYLYKCLFKKL